MSSKQRKELVIPGFGGGYVTAKGATTLASNELAAAENTVIFLGGNGFRTRYGSTAFNSSPMNGGQAGQGLGYLRLIGGSEYLVAVCGGRVYQSTTSSGTMTDITGSVSITAGQNNQWSFAQLNDVLMGVGGHNTPIQWTGSGNVAALTGSPPSGDGIFTYSNRAFIYNTTANPSRIYWSVLANPQDWTSTGSGYADVNADDGEALVAASPINTNTVLLFKQNSIYTLTGPAAPFSIFPFIQGIGAAGPGAVVNVHGVTWFITSKGRLRATDGQRLYDEKDFPNLDNILPDWDALDANRFQYIQGAHLHGKDYEWLVWSVSSTAIGQNDIAFAWDLINGCWIKLPTGFNANGYVQTVNETTYSIGYDGVIYKHDVEGTYTDANNQSASIDWKMESDWMNPTGLRSIIQVSDITLSYLTQSSGSFTLDWGHDFVGPNNPTTISLQASGGVWDTGLWGTMVWGSYSANFGTTHTSGRGNSFKWRLSGSGQVTINKLTLFGRIYGQKDAGA